ncbi:MAG: cytochrome c [Verrucomicrobiae bacterium]|nr:cytochrome c [Verrucomicrobiae bacterium]
MEGAARKIRIVLNGLNGPITVNGTAFNSIMNPFKESLSDSDIAAVLTYVHSAWGNKAGPVSADEVKAIRTETASRETYWTAEELLQVPLTGGPAPASASPLSVEQLKEALKALPAETRGCPARDFRSRSRRFCLGAPASVLKSVFRRQGCAGAFREQSLVASGRLSSSRENP